MRIASAIPCLLPCLLLAGVADVRAQAPGMTQAREALPNGVASGDVTAHGAVLWARARDPGVLWFQLSRRADFLGPQRLKATWIGDPLLPAKVEFNRLRPDTQYFYRAIVFARPFPVRTGSPTLLSYEGRFRTPASPGRRTGLRFGVSGDQRGELAPYPSIRNAKDRELHFFVELGDTIYADIPSPDLPNRQAKTLEEFRIKHREVYGPRFGLNTMAELRSAMSLLSVIDDHEITDDFSGGAAPATDTRFPASYESFINETFLFRTGLQAFHDYNPIRSEFYGNTGDPRTSQKVRLYRARRYGDDAAIFLLDARSFRDPPLASVQNPFNATEVMSFLQASFDPSRTMLGAAQLSRLEQDLVQAERDGVTWKFVMVPEPIQNIGTLGATDRFEGYAAERTKLLSFIHLQSIRNVVFVTADLHGTLVNNLTYQTSVLGPQIPVDAFEIITGPVAFHRPLGPSVVRTLVGLGLINEQNRLAYEALSREVKDAVLQILIDIPIRLLGYDPLGLHGSSLDATLVQGLYTATHVYGWTEFDIDRESQALTVTTWGIDPYSEADLMDPSPIMNRVPEIVSQFVVRPK